MAPALSAPGKQIFTVNSQWAPLSRLWGDGLFAQFSDGWVQEKTRIFSLSSFLLAVRTRVPTFKLFTCQSQNRKAPSFWMAIPFPPPELLCPLSSHLVYLFSGYTISESFHDDVLTRLSFLRKGAMINLLPILIFCTCEIFSIAVWLYWIPSTCGLHSNILIVKSIWWDVTQRLLNFLLCF